MVDEVDVQEERDLPLREASLWREEPAIKRLGSISTSRTGSALPGAVQTVGRGTERRGIREAFVGCPPHSPLRFGANSHPQIGVSSDGRTRKVANTAAYERDDLTVIDRNRTRRRSCRSSIEMVEYASRIGELRTPSEVLDALHVITTKNLPLRVLEAARFPVKAAGWSSIQSLENLFSFTRISRMGGGKSIPRSRRATLRSCFWPGRALLHLPGPSFNGCSNLLESIGGLSS